MTLIDALRSYGPKPPEPESGRAASAPERQGILTADSEVQRLRYLEELRVHEDASAAISDLLDRAVRLLRRQIRSDDLLQEARGDVALKLLIAGPRGVQPGEPDTDAGVQAWVTACVRHAALDRINADNRHEEILSGLFWDAPNHFPAPDQRLRDEERWTILKQRADRARTVMLRGASRNDVEALEDMFELLMSKKTFRDLVVARIGVDTRATRNTLYQRHSRARSRALQRVSVALESGDIDQEMCNDCVGLTLLALRRATSDDEGQAS